MRTPSELLDGGGQAPRAIRLPQAVGDQRLLKGNHAQTVDFQ